MFRIFGLTMLANGMTPASVNQWFDDITTLRSGMSFSTFVDWIVDIEPLKNLILNQNIFVDIFKLSVVFAGGLFMFAVIIELFKIVALNQGNFITVISRFFSVALLLCVFYSSIGTCVTGVNKFIVKTIRPQFMNQMTQVFMNWDEAKQAKEEALAISQQIGSTESGQTIKEKKSWRKKITEWWKKELDGFATIGAILNNLVLGILVEIGHGLTGLILYVSLTVRNIYFAIIIYCGAPCIVCLLFPGTSKFFWSWLTNFCYVLLWPVIMGVILTLQNNLVMATFDGTGLSTMYSTIAHYIVLFIMGTSSFTILPSIIQGIVGAGQTSMALLGTMAFGVSNLSKFNQSLKGKDKSSSNQSSGNGGSSGGSGGDSSPPTPSSSGGGSVGSNSSGSSSGSSVRQGLVTYSSTTQRSDTSSQNTDTSSRIQSERSNTRITDFQKFKENKDEKTERKKKAV